MDPETASFLAELLKNYPLELFQTSPNPTENQKVSDFLVALEMMNRGLEDQGKPPVEWAQDPTSQGSRGMRAWAEGGGRTPQHSENIMRSAQKKALGSLQGMPEQVRSMLAPDAAAQIAENPGGKLTDWAGHLLSQQGNPDPTDPLGPEKLLRLRTDQTNTLLSAGPERSSLLGNLAPEEAALARQLGGVDQLATQYPDVLGRGDPALQPYESRLGPTRGTENPITTRGQSPEQIAAANRSIFSELLGRIPGDEGGPPPLPDPAPARPPLDFIGELMNMLEAQATPDNPDATMTGKVESVNDFTTRPVRTSSRAGMQAQSNLERAQFSPPSSPPRLDQALETELDFPFPPAQSGPDMLEQRPGQSLGLDEAKNIRLGSGGGQVLSGTLLEKILGSAGKAAKGLGQGALSAAPNLLDMGSANNFAEALTGANQEFGGVMTPDSQGNMSPIPVNPGMAALYSMVPFLFDRRRFADDPQYRRQMIGPENIPEIA